jgi:hypothetical protein
MLREFYRHSTACVTRDAQGSVCDPVNIEERFETTTNSTSKLAPCESGHLEKFDNLLTWASGISVRMQRRPVVVTGAQSGGMLL